MDKLANALGLLICLEAAAFGHFEHHGGAPQGLVFHKAWPLQQVVLGRLDADPEAVTAKAPPSEQAASGAELGMCAGPDLALACAP